MVCRYYLCMIIKKGIHFVYLNVYLFIQKSSKLKLYFANTDARRVFKSYQTSKMESFAKIVNSFYMLSSIFDKVLNKREDVFLRVFNRTTTKKFSKGSKSCIRQFAGLVLQVCFLSCLRKLSNIPLKGSKGFFY